MEEIPFVVEFKILSTLTGRRLARAGRELCGEGFTHRQGQIIHFLIQNASRGDLFQRDVEEELSIRRPTATGILQLMEKNGLLRRESVEYDARLKKLVLTDRALALDANAQAVLGEREGRLTADIPPEELAAARRVLERMRRSLERD